MANNFEKQNEKLWNELTDIHIRSYDIASFKTGMSSLDEIQLKELGKIKGKKILHLQCHIGIDTLSLAREGAIVTGVDFSKRSIEYANKLKKELGIKAEFIQSNVYDLKDLLNEKFDIVYSTQGVLCWLKDLKQWAKIIEHFLKPKGFFYLMESHPILNTFEDEPGGALKIDYNYFHNAQPIKWDAGGPDYSADDYIVKNPSFEWQWSLSDIINSLSNAGFKIEFFNEYNKLFYKALPQMKRNKDSWWYLPNYEQKIPLMFTLKAIKE